jgi:hypothetical protein
VTCAAVAVFCGACTFDSTAAGNSGQVADTTGAASMSTEIDPSAPGTSVATSAMTSSDATTADAPSGGEVSGDAETGAPVEHPRSCFEIRLADATAPSGIYEIAPDNAGLPTPIRVYCDMETDNGGWTLVARSVAGRFDEGQFGWGSARGDLEDPGRPYSLNARGAALQFNQVLVGKQGIGYAWGDRVYRFDVGPGFLALAEESMATTGFTTISGDCQNPDMLEHVGYTGDTLVFWLRDMSGFERYGLWHDGFDLYGPTSEIFPCSHAGDLHDEQGMVMVR